nr:GIY-YIG nuclease family protein [Anaerobium acetethylicum]
MKGREIMNYTYILKCSDESLYTGWTNNLEKRIADHNSGKGAKYTRGRGPVSLLYYETFETREEAMRRENEIKKLGRNEKIRLTAGFENPDPA